MTQIGHSCASATSALNQNREGSLDPDSRRACPYLVALPTIYPSDVPIGYRDRNRARRRGPTADRENEGKASRYLVPPPEVAPSPPPLVSPCRFLAAAALVPEIKEKSEELGGRSLCRPGSEEEGKRGTHHHRSPGVVPMRFPAPPRFLGHRHLWFCERKVRRAREKDKVWRFVSFRGR